MKFTFYVVVKLFLFLSTLSVNVYPQWRPTNGPNGGQIIDFCASKTLNSGRIFAGLSGGIFYTDNMGDSWTQTPLWKRDYYFDIKSIRSKSGQNYLYAGCFLGIAVSTNDGITWSYKNNGLPGSETARNINAIDYLEDSTGITLFAATDYGIVKSTNMGSSWIKVKSGTFSSMCVKTFKGKNFIFGGDFWTDYGLIMSTDMGQTWKRIDSTFGTWSYRQLQCYIGNDDKLNLLFCVGDAICRAKYNETENTWKTIPISPAVFTTITSFFLLEHKNVSKIFVSSRIRHTFQDANGVFYSSDEGASWRKMNVNGFNILSVYADTMGVILAGTENNGVFRSTDDGISWKEVNNGLNATGIVNLHAEKDYENNSILFAASYSGIFSSTNKGETWKYLSDSMKNHMAACFYTYNDSGKKYIFTGIYDGKVRMTSDFGLTWHKRDSMQQGPEMYMVNSFLLLPENVKPTTMLASGAALIWKTTDKGLYWCRDINTTTFSGVKSLIIVKDELGNDCILAAGENGVNASLDYAQTWQTRNLGLTGTWCSDIKSYGSAEVYLSSMYGFYYSTNAGSTWIPRNNGLKTKYMNKLLLLPNEKGILAATDAGVFVTFDKGISWQDISTGLPGVEMISLALQDSILYVGTMYNGIYKRPLNEVLTGIDDDNPEHLLEYSLSQNYPNPFNPTTTIKYSIPERGFVTIKVFDLLGREIKTLINEEKQMGSYEVTFNADGLPSGIYFYSIHAGKFSETRKMMLVK